MERTQTCCRFTPSISVDRGIPLSVHLQSPERSLFFFFSPSSENGTRPNLACGRLPKCLPRLGRRLRLWMIDRQKKKGAMTTDPCGFWAGKPRAVCNLRKLRVSVLSSFQQTDLGLTSFRKAGQPAEKCMVQVDIINHDFCCDGLDAMPKVPDQVHVNYLSPIWAPAALGHGKQRAIPNPQKSGCPIPDFCLGSCTPCRQPAATGRNDSTHSSLLMAQMPPFFGLLISRHNLSRVSTDQVAAER
ncbi:hypothetical protein MAPG_08313 [Magnaporthiopsis poae ATCC 64411]|uniref:Uncharacterized protein n=1 Tax=Magnaporthiopsis poae (strain ATCC 64411 / 73-15) TaxID=644358 RepID=A0A0C4E713_MAGP6|nr:hypothetical protein MAPG_08313 [Magnaporthiopsis poae ATCC 64411]